MATRTKYKAIQTGDIYGKWTVKEKDPNDKRKWICECSCGTSLPRPVTGSTLTNGSSTNCNCERGKWYDKQSEAQKTARQDKIKATSLERYGVDNPSKAKEVIDKIANTTLKNHGVTNINHLQSTKDKIREKATQNWQDNKESRLDKCKATSRKNWGTNFPLQNKDRQELLKQTMLNSYNVENALQHPSIRGRQLLTVLDTYEVSNISKLDKIKEQKNKTMLENGTYKTSKPEEEMRTFVEGLGFVTQKLSSKGKEIDIYINNKLIGIEHNGLYYHNELNHDAKYHIGKTEYYLKKGIRILHIWGHWWQDRKPQVKNFLKAVLGVNVTVFGRKTTIKHVEKRVAWEFMEKHHILGANQRTSLALGLFLNEELVMLTTFSFHHRTSKEVVLDRMCSLDGISVIGGLSKLSKAASGILQCDIYTWADRCISSGDGYLLSGWEQISVTKPSYFYYSNKTGKTCSKQSRKKDKVNTPDGMTEHQYALQEGWLQVYDCGKIKFKYPLKTPTETPQS